MLTLQIAYGNKMPILINNSYELISVLLFTKKNAVFLGEN